MSGAPAIGALAAAIRLLTALPLSGRSSALVTSGLHLDGVTDTCDAVFS